MQASAVCPQCNVTVPRGQVVCTNCGSHLEMGYFDKTFTQNSIVVLVLFSLCCGGIALILGIIGIATCKDPVAKRNAIIVLVVGAIVTALGVFMQLGQAAAM